MRSWAAACLAAGLAAGSASAGPGTSGASLLRVGAGARPLAMSDAVTGLPGDLSSLLANPALVSPIASRSLFLMHWPGVADMRTEFASYSLPAGGLGTTALTALFRTLPDIDNSVPGENPVAVNDGLLALTLGRRVGTQGGHAGVTVKLFNSTLGDSRATSIALDLGTLSQSTGTWPIRYGFSLLNLGNPIRHETAGEPLPLTLRGGASWSRSFYPSALSVAGDAAFDQEQNARLAAGAEWLQAGRLALRAGASWSRYAGAGFSAGGGYQFRSTLLGPEAEYHLDYAFVPFSFQTGFAPTNVFSIYIRF